MANHPNRNWRSRAGAAAREWIQSRPWWTGQTGAVAMLSREDLHARLWDAYMAGYDAARRAGRKKDMP